MRYSSHGKQLWQLELRFNRVRSLEGIERMKSLSGLDVWGNLHHRFRTVHRWLDDDDEAEEWIRLARGTQLDLSSPAGAAVHEDWFNAENAKRWPRTSTCRATLKANTFDSAWLTERVTKIGSTPTAYRFGNAPE